MYVVGVDGCLGGWIAVAYDASLSTLTPQIHSTFGELLANYSDAARIAIDVPIGLAQGGTRACDVEARRVLGPRRSSVFPAPDPRLLDAIVNETLDYKGASERSHSILGKGISKQAYAIFPKIAEVNKVLTPYIQERVVEVHPEVSFWALAGRRPMEHHKGKLEGFQERRNHLIEALEGVYVPTREEARRVAPPAKPDDVLDAAVAAWTARRLAEGRSERLPSELLTDARGLRMEMVY